MIRYIHTLLLVAVASLGHAQISPTSTTVITTDTIVTDTVAPVKKIEVDEVEVIKAFEVQLGEAKRIGIAPKVEKTVPKNNTYQYDITIVPAEIEYPAPAIKPLAMNPDANKNADYFYAKLGYGMLSAPYADVSYHHMTPEAYSFTVDAHHYGLNNSDNVPFQKFTETDVTLDGDYVLGENNNIGLKLYTDLRNRSLYDTTLTTVMDNLDRDRSANSFGGEVSFDNIEITSNGWTYGALAGVNVTSINNIDSVAEGHTDLNLILGGGVEKVLSETMAFYVDAMGYLDNLSGGADSSASLNTLIAQPGLKYASGIFSLRAGADFIKDKNNTSPFVDAELGVQVAEGTQVYVGADQELFRNNLTATLEKNPFVQVDTALLRNTISKRIYGGVRGQLFNKITFDISGGYEDLTDQYFYTRNNDNPTLDIGYTDVKNVPVDATIEFQINSNLKVGGIVSQNFFDLEDGQDLYNIPKAEYQAYTTAGFFDNKLQLTGSLGIADEITYINEQGEVKNGDALTDVSAEIDFFITKNIALWARGNNLLDTKYERQVGYPSVGLNVLGGVLFKF